MESTKQKRREEKVQLEADKRTRKGGHQTKNVVSCDRLRIVRRFEVHCMPRSRRVCTHCKLFGTIPHLQTSLYTHNSRIVVGRMSLQKLGLSTNEKHVDMIASRVWPRMYYKHTLYSLQPPTETIVLL